MSNLVAQHLNISFKGALGRNQPGQQSCGFGTADRNTVNTLANGIEPAPMTSGVGMETD